MSGVVDERELARMIAEQPPKCGAPYETREEFEGLTGQQVFHLLDYLILEGRGRGWPLGWYRAESFDPRWGVVPSFDEILPPA